MSKEIWKDISGYEGKYQVSNFGRVKSLSYNKTGEPRLLRGHINEDGYCSIQLSKKNRIENILLGVGWSLKPLSQTQKESPAWTI